MGKSDCDGASFRGISDQDNPATSGGYSGATQRLIQAGCHDHALKGFSPAFLFPSGGPFTHELTEQTVCPGKPCPCVDLRIIWLETFVHKIGVACCLQ